MVKDKLVIVSADGHATMPVDLWPDYLDPEFHRYLPRLRAEQAFVSPTLCTLSERVVSLEQQQIFDTQGAFAAGGWKGLWDRNIRLAEMDREGIAAELIFPGDHHAIDLFWNPNNGAYAWPAADAGVRAFNRWSHATFGGSDGRLLLVGAPLSGLDRAGALAEIDWLADHEFVGAFTPGFCAMPGQSPIYDPSLDSLWRAYAERGIALVTHAGWGLPQGLMHGEMEAAAAEVALEGGGTADLVANLYRGLFNAKGVFNDLRSRRGMWEFMLGGVFDRHPDLKVMVTEIRADWLPATLRLLDGLWETHRDILPARRPPSEYWASNCLAGLSFMNKVEVAMRHEIGVDRMAFGRDYPHAECTWPNTIPLVADVLSNVPEGEVRAILGGNLTRFLGLDATRLAAVADAIDAPTYSDFRQTMPLSPALAQHLDMRCGRSKPAEGETRVPEMAAMLEPEILRMAAAGIVMDRWSADQAFASASRRSGDRESSFTGSSKSGMTG